MKLNSIEIIGPPGVGKTTIYNAICRTWRPSSPWTYPEALISPPPRMADFKNWMQFKLKSMLKKQLTKSIPSEFGFRFIQHQPQLADFCWKQISTNAYSTRPEMKYRALFHLYVDFCRYQAIIEADSSATCLINEGILQKSFLNQNDEASTTRMIERYLQLVPLPKAVIFVNVADPDKIFHRLRTRSKTIATHRNKSKDEVLQDIRAWQYQHQRIASWMLSKGVNVFDIDASKPVKVSSELIAHILTT